MSVVAICLLDSSHLVSIMENVFLYIYYKSTNTINYITVSCFVVCAMFLFAYGFNSIFSFILNWLNRLHSSCGMFHWMLRHPMKRKRTNPHIAWHANPNRNAQNNRTFFSGFRIIIAEFQSFTFVSDACSKKRRNKKRIKRLSVFANDFYR